MKKIIFLLLLFYCSFQNYSQIKFQNIIGSSGNDYGQTIIECDNGDYVIVGHTNTSGSNQDVYILKLNEYGIVQWNKTIGGNLTEYGSDILETNEGNFVITGYSNSWGQGNYDIYIIKIDELGNVIWNKTIGHGGSDQSFSIIQTNDEGLLISGYTPTGGSGNADCNIIKTDSYGNIIWAKVYGGTGYERFLSVIQTTDNGYIGCGYTNSFGYGSYDIFVVKVNENGEILWNKVIGGNNNEFGNSIIQNQDGSYIIAGFTSSYGAGNDDIYLIKLDNSGQLIWTKTIGGLSTDQAYAIIKSVGGGFAVAGCTSSFGNGLNDFYLLKFDIYANLLWSKTVGGFNSDIANSIKQTSDGGYVLIGNTASYGLGGSDIFIVKFDSNGNSCGNISSPISIIGTGGLNTNGGASGTSNFITTVPNYINGYTGSYSTICTIVNKNNNSETIPESHELMQNYPNPFNPVTTIKYSLPKDGKVSILIYDITGKLVRTLIDEYKQAGNFEVKFDASGLASGIYFYKMISGSFVESKKMLLIK